MKNLLAELQELRVMAVEGTSRPVDPNKKETQTLIGFVSLAIRLKTPQVGAETKPDLKPKKIGNNGTACKSVTFIQSRL